LAENIFLILIGVLVAILAVFAAMALKRARSDGLTSADAVCSLLRHAESDARAGSLEERTQAGQKLREFAIGCFVSGAIETSSTLAVLCYWITKAGGLGVSDLAGAPEDRTHDARNLHKILLQQFKQPEVEQIYVPAHSKRDGHRSDELVSIRLPSTMLHEEFGDAGILQGPPPPEDSLEVYAKHPVIQKAREDGWHWSKVRPIGIYFDKVGYTKRDSFNAFYVKDLRTSKRFCSYLVRDTLTFSNQEHMGKCHSHHLFLATLVLFVLDQYHLDTVMLIPRHHCCFFYR
jgi:hypothetical protein